MTTHSSQSAQTDVTEQAIVPVPVFAVISKNDAVVIAPQKARQAVLDTDQSEPLRILLIGDIVGRPGRAAVSRVVAQIKKERGIDLVIAQTENMAHGFGITPDTITEIKTAGVDVFTGGNHTWKNAAGVQLLKSGIEPTVVRPANAKATLAGPTHTRVRVHGFKKDIVVSCLLGQVFMKDAVASPFETADALFAAYENESVHAIFDLHAEATGEKRVFGYYVDGRALAVVGTHTHVQTADEQVLENNTAYITDLGFTGALNSSLGMRRDLVTQKVAHKKDISLEPPEDIEDTVLQGVLITIDRITEQAIAVERVQHTSL